MSLLQKPENQFVQAAVEKAILCPFLLDTQYQIVFLRLSRLVEDKLKENKDFSVFPLLGTLESHIICKTWIKKHTLTAQTK